MNDRTRVAMCAGLGALVGGVAGYLFLTERGGELRNQFEPKLDELMTEVQKLGSAFERTRRAVDEGWRSFGNLAADAPAAGESWKPGRRDAS